MSEACERCHEHDCQWHYDLKVHREASDVDALACCNRALLNLRSGIRAQLERAHEWLTIEPVDLHEVRAELEAAIEALS